MCARILIVDDHPMVRSSVREFLTRQGDRFQIVGEAGTAVEAMQAITQLEPDLAIVDIELPGGETGVDLARRIKRTYPAVAVLVLTAHTGLQRINAALDAGANGYLLKDCSVEELVTAVEATLRGQIYLSPTASTAIIRDYQRQIKGEENETLTAREVEILRLIANGQTTKEIAFAMQVSTKTVETHRVNVMNKLNINTVAGLTKYAVREGLCRLQ